MPNITSAATITSPAAATIAQTLWPRPVQQPAAALTRDLFLALGASLMVAASAQITLPLPLVPITAQTFAVLLTGALLGPRLGALALILYLAEGIMGMPVFSAGRSAGSPSSLPGVPQIWGPTAGYLFAYPFAAGLIGLLATRGWDRKPSTTLCAMLLGSLVIYAGGAGWLAHFVGLSKAIAFGIVPFILGDIIKALLAAALLPLGWKALARLG